VQSSSVTYVSGRSTNQTYDISSNPSHEAVREGRSELGSYALKDIR
jgi:hypothetical protein